MNIDLLKFLNLQSFIAIDVETTGLDENKDKIIEISAVKFNNGVEADTFSYLIDPKREIPQFIEKLTGITNDSIKNKPTFDIVSEKFLDFIGNNPIVGHNIGFDVKFINNELDFAKLKIKSNYVCDTYILSRIFFYYLNSFKLESICAKLNISTGTSHRALDDARSAGFLFLKIINQVNSCDLNTCHMLSKATNKFNIYNNVFIQNILNYRIENNNSIKSLHNEKSNYYIFSKKDNQEINEVSDILGPDSILINNNKKFQYRENQLLFSESCSKTILNKSILIAEAGTGLGKSFGYLAPSIMNIDNKNVVISTSTHNLQSQLLHKDIPMVSQYFNKSIKAVVIKGQNNYLCYEKLYKLTSEIADFLDIEDVNELITLIYWANNTITGDISECESFNVKRNKKIWDLVKFDAESCYLHSRNKKNKCFYNNILEESKDANIFIVNHSLLARNADNQDLIYNNASVCIIDEAHNFIENSRSQLSNSLSHFDIKKDYNSLDKFFDKLRKDYNINDSILNQFKIYQKQGLDLIQKIKDLSFDLISSKIENDKIFNGNYSIDFRIISVKHENEHFIDKIEFVINLLKSQFEMISKIKNDLEVFFGSKFNYSQKSQLVNIQNRCLKNYNIIKEEFFSDNPDFIKWIKVFIKDSKVKMCLFNTAPFTISKTVNKVCANYESLIFCSATLSIDGDFSYFVDDSALDSCIIDKDIDFKNFPSPFFYKDQIKLFLYNSNEDINSNSYIHKISNLVLDFKSKIKKRMLILCTSYKQINDFKNVFKNSKLENIYYQSLTSSKENLLKQYIENDGAVLFGTSSFWEGIDLPNDLLEILIILKVPFENPHNPIVGAKIDFYNQIGRNSFYEYQIPKAILKLRQGIGRLIRTDEDSGVCILTDPRLVNKKYGNIIVETLPSEAIITTDKNLIINKAEKFLNL